VIFNNQPFCPGHFGECTFTSKRASVLLKESGKRPLKVQKFSRCAEVNGIGICFADFRKYLACGIQDQGFALSRCAGCVIDGLFSAEDEALRFDAAAITPEAIAKLQAEVKEWSLRLFKQSELLAPETVDGIREWGHARGFSLNAKSPYPPRIAPARAPPDWLEADIDQTRRNESKQARSPCRSLPNRQDRRLARPKAARRVVHKDVRHEFDQTVSG
jgi:hypothetical protein